jgi:hypothetical protein
VHALSGSGTESGTSGKGSLGMGVDGGSAVSMGGETDNYTIIKRPYIYSYVIRHNPI